MDKSWMYKPRQSREYQEGVDQFLEFAFNNESINGKIICPCKYCVNSLWQTRDEVKVLLICDGFLRGYTQWVCHGEVSPINDITSSSSAYTFGASHVREDIRTNLRGLDNMEALLRDTVGMIGQFGGQELGCQLFRNKFDANNDDDDNDDGDDDDHQDSDEEVENLEEGIFVEQLGDEYARKNSNFLKLLKDANEELFPGCKTFSKLSFIVHLYHIKCLGGWSEKSFTKVFDLLSRVFSQDSSWPKSAYEAKKIVKTLGLNYEKIHVCKHDCMLFWGENASAELCHICGTSRWADSTKKRPVKVLRYFPLIPRLQRFFILKQTANDMRWHDEGRNKDGILRHPADGEAWKSFDARYPDFSSDARNVRLALSSDGFNPFRMMSCNYSVWPVVLVPYNLPPWIGMKQHSFILSMIIPGDKGPTNDIDVFLQPLIEELKKLWEGVETYDASKNQMFHMRAALMWTINDFLAYAYLSGWSTKGKFACPCCAENTSSMWLCKGKTYCYMCTRRWLPEDHQFRYQKQLFDGTEELRPPPKQTDGCEVLNQLEGLQFSYGKFKKRKNKKKGKGKNKRKRAEQLEIGVQESNEESSSKNDKNAIGPMKWWKKKSIFFMLPYWKHNLLRHNLDLMHIEKNVCDNLIGTFLGLEKSKDNLQARLDLVDIGVRPELHPQFHENCKNRIPPACFTLSKEQKEVLCQVLKNIKVPDGYASNISRCVNLQELKVSGLKSHDCHILVEDMLPLALRACNLPKEVTKVVIELATIFKLLCSKVVDVNELEKLQNQIVITLCQMEKIFLPPFFTIMVHLIIHLVEEIKLGGPVNFRWMYPFERFFTRFKSYVKNRTYPEGSIAEGYIAEECLTFCSRYLEGIETRFNRPLRNPNPPINDQVKYLFSSAGQPIGKVQEVVLDENCLVQAHRYVLRHCDEIKKFRDEFIEMEKRKRRRHTRLTEVDVDKLVNENFHVWFRSKVLEKNHSDIPEEIVALGVGRNKVAKRYSGFIINGFRFHTKSREKNRRTQNSGVVNTSEVGSVNYYGRLQDIIELDYYSNFKVVLFKCDWVDVHHNMGIRQDEFGFTLVNFSRLIHTGEKLEDDPYVFSSQVEQVFYVQDPKNENWSIVVNTKPRDLFDMGV